VAGGESSTAIEVELTIKQPTSRYVLEVFDRLRPDVGTVIYLCPSALRPLLASRVEWALQSAGLSDHVSVVVRALPSVGSKLPSAGA
jgi:hypothetical protein